MSRRPERNVWIETLGEELEPVRIARVGSAWAIALALGWSAVVILTMIEGPLRPGALGQLVESPRFLAEMVIGWLAGAAFFLVGFASGVPGRPLHRSVALAGIAAAVWVGSYVVGLWVPAVEPSMLGKREGCEWQTLLFALPALALSLGLARRFAPLHRARTGLAFGAAAGALPGLFMQLACMLEPWHVLTHHLAPILVVAGLGALFGPLVLRRI